MNGSELIQFLFDFLEAAGRQYNFSFGLHRTSLLDPPTLQLKHRPAPLRRDQCLTEHPDP
ncbi:MAG: hypothetical protein ACPL7K_07870, partial [Armatimonadota bacterium]